MIEMAIQEAAEAGLENVSFAACDVELTKFDQTFDYAYSRMGTMFFASPVAALRNVREALAPGGLLNMVVWRRKLDNEFMHRAELVVAEYLEEPEESEVPRCGPGPFSMANADTVTDVLKHAGYEDIRLARQDLPYRIGNDLEQAVAFNMALGPAAEVLRMWGERVDDIRPKIADDLREALGDFVVDGGEVVAPDIRLGRDRAGAAVAPTAAKSSWQLAAAGPSNGLLSEFASGMGACGRLAYAEPDRRLNEGESATCQTSSSYGAPSPGEWTRVPRSARSKRS